MQPFIVNLTCVFPRRNQASELLGFCWTAPSKRSTALGMSPEKIGKRRNRKFMSDQFEHVNYVIVLRARLTFCQLFLPGFQARCVLLKWVVLDEFVLILWGIARLTLEL